MVLRLTSCSPRRSGLFVTVAGGYLFRQLDAGVEASEPHDLAVRKIGALVLALPASTASRPSSVTIAKRPFVGRDARDIKVILVKRERKYFCKWGWTGELAKHELICPSGKIRLIGSTNYNVSAAAVSSLASLAGRGGPDRKELSSSGLTGRSSTPRLFGSITGVSDYWITRLRG
jgi:hypothetical protein